MIFPAWYDFARDAEIQTECPTTLPVYATLLQDQRILTEARDVKAWLLARQLRAKKRTIYRALATLTRRGYLVDYGRGENNVRRVRVAVIRVSPAPAGHPSGEPEKGPGR